MGRRHLLGADGGVVSTIEYEDPEDITRGFNIISEQECDGILRQVRQERDRLEALPDGGRKAEFRPVAKIPNAVVAQAMREGWFHDRKAWAAWLNNSDHRAFRITGGRV